MERHCPRGQSPSRVVAPVKKKKKCVTLRNFLLPLLLKNMAAEEDSNDFRPHFKLLPLSKHCV
jgi:hypothetical protein